VLCALCKKLSTQIEVPSAISREAEMDRLRTVHFPVEVGATMSYYDVTKLWASETLRAKKLIQQVLRGDHDHILPQHFKNAQSCDIGRWLEQVKIPDDRKDVLDGLRLWHAIWHEGSERLFLQINEGQFGDAQSALKTRAHSWHYAKRKVDKLLNALWCGDSGEDTLTPAAQVPIQVASSTHQIPIQHAS
jgi:hypothetical protein